MERPRAHSFDEAEANLSHDSDSDLNTLPTPARKHGISRFIRGADCLEVNVDVSESFTYIARGAIYLVTDKLRDIRIKFGFVVEGRERDELCGNQNS